MTEKKEQKEEIVEHNSVETTTDISAPVGERTEVIESTTKSEVEETDNSGDEENE